MIFPWRYVGVLLIGLLLGAGAGWRAEALRSGAKLAALQSSWDAERAAQMAAARQAEAEHRRIEQQRQTDINEVTTNAQHEIDAAHAAAGAAARTADGLRRQLAAYTAAHRGAPGDSRAAGAGAREQGADPLDLLAELFAGADGAAGELAGYADRVRIAGAACERSYEALRVR